MDVNFLPALRVPAQGYQGYIGTLPGSLARKPGFLPLRAALRRCPTCREPRWRLVRIEVSPTFDTPSSIMMALLEIITVYAVSPE